MGIWLPEGVASSASINTMRIQRKESIFRAEVNLIISKTAFSRVSESSLRSKDGCRPRFLAFSWSLILFLGVPLFAARKGGMPRWCHRVFVRCLAEVCLLNGEDTFALLFHSMKREGTR